MRKKGQIELEEVIKGVVGIFVVLLMLGSLSPIIGPELLGISSALIGLVAFLVIFAIVFQILNKLGVIK